MKTMARIALLLAVLAVPATAEASDFSPLLLLLLIPYSIAAVIVWASTWLTTSKLKRPWLRKTIRSLGLCLIFTPTHTDGGNGRMYSVALYDMVMSGLGGDPVYAVQAVINALVATAIVSTAVIVGSRAMKRRVGP